MYGLCNTYLMVSKAKPKFTMQMQPGDVALFKRAKAKTGLISQAETIRMALKLLAKGGR